MPALEKAGIDPATLPHATGMINLVALLAILLVSYILVRGMKESANLNSAIVIVKVSIVLVFIMLALKHVLANPQQAIENWTPFLPENQNEFGKFGWSGVCRAAGVFFFAYIGFDAFSTAAQEAKIPERDMPIGILGSLVVCTVLYILVTGLLTGVVKYTALNVAEPVAIGIDATGVKWGSFVVKLGAIFGLGSVMLVMLMGQSRVFFSMARDGLMPKWAGAIHPTYRTPYISTIVVGIFVAIFAGFVPIHVLGELVSIGTLLAFVIVCAGIWVMRVKHPDMHRPFRCPGVPFVPLMGILVSLGMMASLPGETWIRLFVWLGIGMAVYLGYGIRHSRVQSLKDPTLT
jgi:APA family basic amino acid/polyamine antiporter